ncbi:MAG: hypothetical protein IJC88_01980 [Oscillospiraceae bacterium]|nr:hypothetical protein [Oscillospiraceae bacterium]
MKKRILSLLLVVCMIVCMLPTFGASATGTDYVYDLTRLQTGAGATEGVDPITIREYEDLDALDNYYNRTTDPFKLFNQSGGMTWKWTEESHNGVGPTIVGNAGHFGALAIKVGKSALYDISLRLLDNAAATSLDFYFLPMSVAQTVSGANYSVEYLIGSTNFTETTPTLKDVSFGEQYLEAGEYVLVFMSTLRQEGLTAISRISLNWVADEKPGESYCYNLGRLQWGQWSSQGNNPDTLTDYDFIYTLGNYYSRTTDPFMYYGQSDGMSWTWTSSSMGKVDGDGPRGPSIESVKGEWCGIKINLEQAAAQYDLKVRFANTKDKMPSLKIYVAPANAENPRHPMYEMGTAIPKGDGDFSVVTESFGTCYLAPGEYAVVFENITGKTTYAGGVAEVCLDFISYDEPAAKAPQTYHYDLARLQTGEGATDGIAPIDIRKWGDLAKYDNYYNRECAPFILWNQSGGMTWKWTEESHNGVGPTIIAKAGHFGGITIHIGESGLYDISFKLLDDATATPLNFYLMPLEESKDSMGGSFKEEHYLGATNFTETTPTLKNVNFGMKYLEAGDYALAMSAKAQGEGLTAISSFTFTGLTEKETLNLNTTDGAAIRITEPQGMRFTSTIDRALADSDNVVEYGTILMPTDDLDGDINNLVVGYSKNGHTAITAPALIHYAEDEDTYTFTAVLIDTLPKYYSRSISARAYIKLADGRYIYSETSTARSIRQVAELILKNADATAEEKAVAQEIVDTVLNLESKDNDAAWPWN